MRGAASRDVVRDRIFSLGILEIDVVVATSGNPRLLRLADVDVRQPTGEGIVGADVDVTQCDRLVSRATLFLGDFAPEFPETQRARLNATRLAKPSFTLRTRFRPLHGNFNPIRNISRVAGRASSGKKGTTAQTAAHRPGGTAREEECCVRSALRCEVSLHVFEGQLGDRRTHREKLSGCDFAVNHNSSRFRGSSGRKRRES